MSITLSDSAAARVNTFLANRGKGFGLRLGVRTSGCSGMAYVLEFVDEPTAEDTVFEDKGVKVVVAAKASTCNRVPLLYRAFVLQKSGKRVNPQALI
ncbi:iron-sulfur cluster assembly accessory protein [Salmonella enterica]|nr:iron-sulfur cluster assembly accessory protein [Salmonella enterica]